MTTEEALEWFEGRKTAITMSGARAMYDKAIAALRAQAEAEKNEPLVDAVPVVRCKDCRFLYFKDMSAYCPDKVTACSPNGFCSHGERRE